MAPFRERQRSVARPMMLALGIGVVVILGGLAHAQPAQLGTRLATLGATTAILGLWLAVAIGRTLFWAGYAQDAAGRAFGFALTFYPSVPILLATVVVLITR